MMHRVLVLMSLGAACSSAPVVASPAASPVTLAETAAPPSSDLYRDAGFIVGTGSIPFVGRAGFTATEFLDSTAVLVSVSIPPRALSFVRAGDRYAAFYSVRIDLQRAGTITRSDRAAGEVRVASFAETNRGDEGVLFQRVLRVAPGDFELRITTSDSLGTGTGVAAVPLAVPALPDGGTSSAMTVFLAQPRATRAAPLAIVANPTATARYGRDTALFVYAEAYGATAPDLITFVVRDDQADSTLYADSASFPAGDRVRVAQMSVPASRLKLGRNTLVISRGSNADTIPAMLTLGVDLPIAGIEELADALRYFASEAELRGLRGATAQARPAQWAALLHKTDPNPSTPENEMLLEYARRFRLANSLYREGMQPGWKSARGSVLLALGEPDAINDGGPQDPVSGVRTVVWEYKRHRLTLVFTDVAGPGVWKLTPASDSDFRTLVAFSGPCVGCR